MYLKLTAIMKSFYLLEMISQPDYWCSSEHSLLVNDQLAMFQRIYVTLYQKQVGTRFDREEPRTRYVDTVGIAEVLDSRPSRSFKLKRTALNEEVWNATE